MSEQPLRPALFDAPPEGQPAVLASQVTDRDDTPEVTATSGAEQVVRAERGLPLEPALLDLPKGMAAGRIDHGWAPGVLRVRAVPPGSLSWIAGGVAVLLLGWLVLSAVGFVSDQFARSAAMGWATVLVFGAGLLLVLWGL